MRGMKIGGGLVASGATSASITAVVTRADGRVEDLGIISYWHRNPLKRAAYFVKKKLKLKGS